MKADFARQRSMRLASGIISSLLSRGLGLVAPLLMIPVALSTLGAERYGLWTAVTSLTAMALFSDFGLGNGLMTRLSETFVSGDTLTARQYIMAGTSMTAGIAFLLLAGLLSLVAIADPVAWIDPGSGIPSAEGELIVVLCFAAFAVNIPISLVHRVQYAYQQVTYSNIWTAAGSLASLAAFAAAATLGAPSWALIACAVFAPPAINLLNALTYFRWREPALNPLGTHPTMDSTKRLLRLGGAFFLLSIVTSIALNVDPTLISRALGLEAAAAYAVAFRISSAVGLLVTLVNLPLWPANGEALARGDVEWVRRSTWRMVIISGGLVALVGAALYLAAPGLSSAWLGESSGIFDRGVLGWLLLWSFLLACTSPVFMVQNAAGIVAPQLAGWFLFMILSLPLKWHALDMFGMEAAPAVACMTYGVVVIPASLVGMRLALGRAESRPLSGSR